MASAELLSAVLVADIVLYGFMIAYYAISLNLHELEKSRLHARFGAPGGADAASGERSPAPGKADEAWVGVLASAASGSMFLLGCTLFAVPAAAMAVLALAGIDVVGLAAVVLFLAFLVVVAAGMAGVGVQSFRQNVRDARAALGAEARLMDVLTRGLGKR